MQITAGSIFNQKYEIISAIGEGGFASVYKARDLELGRIVALKILKMLGDQNDLSRFQREAKLLAQISHPNIVSIYAFEILSPSNLPYIVMEFLQGESLLSLIKRQGKLSSEQTVQISLQILSGLSAAHEAGVVHRDLSPQNIILSGSAAQLSVKLIDFGLSKLPANSAGSEKLTKTGFLLGNPSYMSPEQARAESNLSQRSDIYSFGCILYECLSGRPPFEAENPVGLLFKQQEEYPPEPQMESKDRQAEILKLTALRCLQKDPTLRFESCKQIRQALLSDGAALNEEARAMQLHGYAGANDAAALRKSGLNRGGLIRLAAAVAVISAAAACILQPQILSFAATSFAASAAALAPNQVESFADRLLQEQKSKQALKLYEELSQINLRQMKDKPDLIDLQCKYIDLSLKKANCLALSNKEKSLHELEESCRVLSQLNGPCPDKLAESLIKALDRNLMSSSVSSNELLARVRFLKAYQPALRGPNLETAFQNLLIRSCRLLTLKKTLPQEVLDYLNKVIASKQIILSDRDDRLLDLLFSRLSAASMDKEKLELLEARCKNPGTPEFKKERFAPLLILKKESKNPERMKQRIKDLIASTNSPELQMGAYSTLASYLGEAGLYRDELECRLKLISLARNSFNSPFELYAQYYACLLCYKSLNLQEEANKMLELMFESLEEIFLEVSDAPELRKLNLGSNVLASNNTLKEDLGQMLYICVAFKADHIASRLLKRYKQALNSKLLTGSAEFNYMLYSAFRGGQFRDPALFKQAKDFLSAFSYDLNDNLLLQCKAREYLQAKKPDKALACIDTIRKSGKPDQMDDELYLLYLELQAKEQIEDKQGADKALVKLISLLPRELKYSSSDATFFLERSQLANIWYAKCFELSRKHSSFFKPLLLSYLKLKTEYGLLPDSDLQTILGTFTKRVQKHPDEKKLLNAILPEKI